MMQGCVGDSALIVGQERTLKYEHNMRWTRRCFKTTSHSSSKFTKKRPIESKYISQWPDPTNHLLIQELSVLSNPKLEQFRVDGKVRFDSTPKLNPAPLACKSYLRLEPIGPLVGVLFSSNCWLSSDFIFLFPLISGGKSGHPKHDQKLAWIDGHRDGCFG
jgi:hypothetical protein